MTRDPSDPPNATWADIKQFGWGLLLLCPFVAVFAYGARVLVGPRAAFWVAVGTVGVAVAAWGSVIVACLIVSYGNDAAHALLRRRRLVRARLSTGPADAVFHSEAEHRLGADAMTLGALLRKPSAFTPLAMSLAALALIVAVVATVGITPAVTRPHDEGTPARIFQLLLLLQVPIAAAFAIKWFPRAPRPAALVLLMQAGAALLAVATIVWLER